MNLSSELQEIKVAFIKAAIWFGIYLIIGLAWQVIDTLEFGKPQPSIADTIFGAALAYAIYRSWHIKVITKRQRVPGEGVNQ